MPKIRALSDLKQALEAQREVPIAHKAPVAPSISTSQRPVLFTTLLRDAQNAAWYSDKIDRRVLKTPKEPDPTADYLGPRFCPPIPKGQGRKKRFALS